MQSKIQNPERARGGSVQNGSLKNRRWRGVPLPRGMRLMKEGDIVKPCIAYLHAAGCLAWRNNTGAVKARYKGRDRFIRFGAPGISDILGVLPGGRFLAVEVKTRTGKATPDQVAFLAEVKRAGGVALLVRSVEELHAHIQAARQA